MADSVRVGRRIYCSATVQDTMALQKIKRTYYMYKSESANFELSHSPSASITIWKFLTEACVTLPWKFKTYDCVSAQVKIKHDSILSLI